MGIKCSLLGHKFSGTNVEEEREEQGSEVVITIREVETCDRCGESRVVSENKEVTSLETQSEPDEEPQAAEPAPDAEEPTTSPAPDMDAAEDDAELIGEAEPEPVEAEDSPDDVGDDGFDEPVDADSDDAVILEDSSDDRSTGEWPDEDDEESDDSGDVENAPSSDVESAAAGAEDDTAEQETDEWPDVYTTEEEPEPGAGDVAWPEEDERGDEEWDPSESLTKTIEDREIEPAGAATVTVPEGEFVCEECGFATPVEESSLRAGDFCPECHRGTLAHRTDDETRKE